MDFLNKSFAQVKDLFLSMTPGARITAGLLLLAVVVSLGYLFRYQVAGPGEYLLGGEPFPHSQLTDMEAAFAEAGLSGHKVENGQIRIPRGQHSAYVAALAAGNALPYEYGEYMTSSMQDGSVYKSKDLLKQSLSIAKQQELSQIINWLPGIRKAAVIYDAETKRGLVSQTIKSASVIVTPKGNGELDLAVAASIRRLVKGAFAGLKAEEITVTDANTGLTVHNESGAYGGALSDPMRDRQRNDETYYREKVLRALARIPGVEVTTYVELSPNLKVEEEQVKHDPKTVAFETIESTVSEKSGSGSPAGPPGYMSQQMGARSLASSSNTSTNEEREESQTQQTNVISSQITKKDVAGLTQEMVKVGVSVPTSYFKKVWLEQNPPEEGAEPTPPDPAQLTQIQVKTIGDIKSLVAGVLPAVEGMTDLSQLVTVTVFEDITPPPIQGPGMTENAMAWIAQYWSTLGMLGLAGFSLITLRSMIRAAPGDQTGGSIGFLPPESGQGAEESNDAPQKRKLKQFGSTSASLRDELSELVGEDPDTAANILQNWIGSVS